MKSLLVLGLIACLLFGWMGRNVYHARQEVAAIEALKRADAGLGFHNVETGDGWLPLPKGDRSSWRGVCATSVRQAFGYADRPRVRSVELRDDDAPESDLRAAVQAMSRLPEIEVVDLNGREFDDVDCAALSRLPRLRDLTLDRTSIGDAGLSQLASLGELRKIFILGDDGPNVAAGLAHLRQLRVIDLSRVSLSRSEMEGIASLPELRSLWLHGAQTEEKDAFAPLGQATSLQALIVRADSFPGKDLSAIGSSRDLEYLHISDADDKTLLSLEDLDSLRGLELWGSSLSLETVGAFAATRPKCVIKARVSAVDSSTVGAGERLETYYLRGNSEPARHTEGRSALRIEYEAIWANVWRDYTTAYDDLR